MGVIEVSTRGVVGQLKLVIEETTTGWDGGLRHSRGTIGEGRSKLSETVKVDGEWLVVELIDDSNPDPLTLLVPEHGAWGGKVDGRRGSNGAISGDVSSRDHQGRRGGPGGRLRSDEPDGLIDEDREEEEKERDG